MDYFYQQKLINEKNQLQRQLMEANHELNQLKAIVQEMTEILNAEPLEEGQRRVGRVGKGLDLDLDDPVVKPEKRLTLSQVRAQEKALGINLDDPVVKPEKPLSRPRNDLGLDLDDPVIEEGLLDKITYPIDTMVDRSINFLNNKGFKTSKSIRDAWEKKKAAETQKPTKN